MMQLTQEQEAIASIVEGEHIVNAGPGTGKTHTLIERTVRRLRDGAIAARMLVVTFTKVAQKEFKQRLLAAKVNGAAAVDVRTLHSWGLHVLQEEGLVTQKSLVGYAIVRMLQDIYRELGLREVEDANYPLTPAATAKRISLCKTLGHTANSTTLPCYLTDEEIRVYKRYEQESWERGIPDFDDMILRVYHLFRDVPTTAARWASRYDHVMVDEAQDCSAMQYSILDALRGQTSYVLIGHDSQSCYRWRRATPEQFVALASELKCHGLTQNHRSTEPIVRVCESLIKYNTVRLDTPNVTQRKGRTPTYTWCEDPTDQAETVVDNICEDLRNGLSPSDIGVLYRVHRLGGTLERNLRGADIPYHIKGGTSFYTQGSIKPVLDYVRLVLEIGAAGPEALEDAKVRNRCRPYLTNIYWRPARFLGKVWLNDFWNTGWVFEGRWATGAHALYSTLEMLSKIEDAATLVESILHTVRGVRGETLRDHLVSRCGESDDINDVSALDEDWAQLSALAYICKTPEKLLDYIDAILESQSAGDAVQLSTIHGSKGSEFKSVHVIGVNEGIIPHYYACKKDLETDGVECVEEERRLAYIAFSRAEHTLRVYGMAQDWRGNALTVSRFVEEAGLTDV